MHQTNVKLIIYYLPMLYVWGEGFMGVNDCWLVSYSFKPKYVLFSFAGCVR